MDKISVRGAKTHNLKNIDVTIPRDKLVVMTGLSGSGKSSLAFDTLYAEGQRRYVESLSAYARQFLSLMEKPDVEHIEGLSPAISIEQKSTSKNPRSTVGTITEIHDYLRLLFARVGIPHCPTHDFALEAQSISQMVDHVLSLEEGTKLMLLAPVVHERKGEYIQLFKNLQKDGFLRAIVNGELIMLDSPPELDRYKKHSIEVVVDRFKVRQDLKLRLAESFETALHLSEGIANIAPMDNPKAERTTFSSNYACHHCGYSLQELEPRLFSFNSPAGACPTCDGLGVMSTIDEGKIIINPELSISEGAIRAWNKSNAFYYQQLASLAKHYKFTLDTPFNQYPEKIQTIILHGSGDEKIDIHYVSQTGTTFNKKKAFEGIIPNIQRRLRESDSNIIRDEITKLMSQQPCTECHGERLNEAGRHVFINDHTVPSIANLSIADAHKLFKNIKLTGNRAEIAEKILKEILLRLSFLVNVGLDYLTLSRRSETLSGGEAQRIRLASQIGAGLVGVMYILDEPSIGLHQRDNQRLLSTLFHLRDLGNTVIMVEHDEEAILMADHVIDMGPGAGLHGGEIVAQGTPNMIKKAKGSITGEYLSGKKSIVVPKVRMAADHSHMIKLKGATGNNLKNINAEIPLGLLTCITGVSGSGKSTLINQTLYPLCAKTLNRASSHQIQPYQSISGLEHLDKVVDIDQSPIGRTPRSNPSTYVGLFTLIRDLYTQTPEARSRGYKPGRFSFNVKGGRCEACEGDGVIKVEMHFLSDIYVTCDVCKGKRYNRETLEIKYKGKSIDDVLSMSVEEALDFFFPIPAIAKKLQTLMDVGLSYIKLGQRATTLSGGEAQRIKLSRELSKRDTGSTLYILDEPTTGLHFHDIKQLLDVLLHLRNRGNTIVVIEHNLDVIKTADWIIDLGPEGGDKGGQVLCAGTPETVAASKDSHTGRFLKQMLK